MRKGQARMKYGGDSILCLFSRLANGRATVLSGP